MVNGENKLELRNSKGKLMRTELPKLRLGEGIEKLITDFKICG